DPFPLFPTEIARPVAPVRARPDAPLAHLTASLRPPQRQHLAQTLHGIAPWSIRGSDHLSPIFRPKATKAARSCASMVKLKVEHLSTPCVYPPLIPPAGCTACTPVRRSAACPELTDDVRGLK